MHTFPLPVALIHIWGPFPLFSQSPTFFSLPPPSPTFLPTLTLPLNGRALLSSWLGQLNDFSFFKICRILTGLVPSRYPVSLRKHEFWELPEKALTCL